MSEALRAMQDAPDDAFQPEPIEGESAEFTQPESAEPDAPQTVTETPQAESEPESPKKEKEPKKLSKYELEKARLERDKRRADQAYAKLQQAEEQKRQVLEENARLKAEAKQAAEKARIDSNPVLREAVSLLGQGYKPEDCEAEAVRLDANGDIEGGRGMRAIAIQMRNHLDTQAKAGQAEQAEASQTAWRQYQFGTAEFDKAGYALKPGNQEFDDYWATVETGLIERCKASSDPIDQEIGKTFRDHNSPFGRRMVEFLSRTAIGQAFKNHALGMVPAFDMVKQAVINDHLLRLNQQLTQELNKYRGLTSFAPSAPAGYTNGSSEPHYMAPDLSLADLQRLDMDKFRQRLRSRIRD
jgi:hypothetical protein